MRFCLIAVLLSSAGIAHGRTWQVGATRQYKAPSEVMALVATGDTVEIDSGLYIKDVGAWNADSLVLRCSVGFAHLDAQSTAAQRKAIWVINGKHTYVEGIEFSGCAISAADGDNGAGIRLQSTSLECRRCYFHDNQEGILTGNDTTTEVNIEACEFDHNGVETGGAAGFEHNIYIGHSRSARVAFCYFHRSIVGHELKCRANRSYILYNHIVDEDGDGSLSIDLPNGGLAFVIGNSVEKGPNTANSTIFGYGEEQIINPDSEYYFINNTVVSDRVPTTFINLQKGAVATLKNNIIVGNIHPLVGWSDTAGNLFTSDTGLCHFVDRPKYDYHISQVFPDLTATAPYNMVQGFSLQPEFEFRAPLDSLSRKGLPGQIGAFALRPKTPEDRVKEANILSASNYPNPFSSQSRLFTPMLPDGVAQIRVLNCTGSLIEQRPVMIEQHSATLSRNGLASGTYRYEIISPHGSLQGSFVIE